MNVRERQTLVEKPWLDRDEEGNNPLDLRTWVASTTFGKENSSNTKEDDGGNDGDDIHDRSRSRKQRIRETFHLMKMQEFKEKQKRLKDLEGASERWKQKLKDKEEEEARRKQEYKDRKAAAKEARLQAKREKKLQEKKEAKLQAKRAERARQKKAKEAAMKAEAEGQRAREEATRIEAAKKAEQEEIQQRNYELARRIEEEAATNMYEDEEDTYYVEEVVEEVTEVELEEVSEVEIIEEVTEVEVEEEEIFDWVDTDDGSFDDYDSAFADSSMEELNESEYLELEESAFFEYLAAEEEKRVAEEAAELERIRLEEKEAAEREARLTESERRELEAIKAAEEEQNRIMAEEEERLRLEKAHRLTALENGLKLAKEKAELESKQRDEEKERRKKEEAKNRAKKQDFLDVSLHLKEKLVFKPPKTLEEVEAIHLEEEKVPERQIGEVPPSLKAMIVAASLELRPVPKEHKQTFRPIASDAASMGRLTRLKEQVIEKWGEKELEVAKGESKSSVLAKPRGMRRRNKSLTKKVSQSEKILHEAAALGRLRGRKQNVISKYGEQGERNVEDEDSENDKEIDDLRDEHGARVFRTEYLADRHMDVRRSVIERTDWVEDLEEDDPMDSEHVDLPCEEAPKFKVQKTKKPSLELKEQLAQGVAEGYWNRYSRLERPGARLKMSEGCQCKYCHNPSEAQTHAYQKKWADKKLEGIFTDGEDIKPEEDRHGWLTGLFLPPEPEPEPQPELVVNPGPDSQLATLTEEEQGDGDEVAEEDGNTEEEIGFEQNTLSNIPAHHLHDDNIIREEIHGETAETSFNDGNIEEVVLADDFDDEGSFAEETSGDQENSQQMKYTGIESSLGRNNSVDREVDTRLSPSTQNLLKPDDFQGRSTPPKADDFDDSLFDQASTDDFDDDVCDQASTDDFDDNVCDQASTDDFDDVVCDEASTDDFDDDLYDQEFSSQSVRPKSMKPDGAGENGDSKESAPDMLPMGSSVPLTAEDNSSGEEARTNVSHGNDNDNNNNNNKDSRLWGWIKGISKSIGEKRKESSRNRRKQKRQQQNQKRNNK